MSEENFGGARKPKNISLNKAGVKIVPLPSRRLSGPILAGLFREVYKTYPLRLLNVDVSHVKFIFQPIKHVLWGRNVG